MSDLNNLNKEQLLLWIDQLCFCADDMLLYLDTHPDDEDALEYFNQCKEIIAKAKSVYESKYGLLSLEDACNLNKWDWNAGPAPWDNCEGGRR